MIHWYPLQATTVPALALPYVGLVAWAIALRVARLRRKRAAAEVVAQRRSASWIWIALQGVAFFFVTFGPIRISSDWSASVSLLQDAVIVLLVIATIWLFSAASRALGKNWALVARTRADHDLVQSGPFAHVRHPIYVALFCYVLALAVALGHLWGLVLAAPVYWFATWMRIRHEEAILREQFGPAYDAYAKRVKRFVPGVV